MCESLLLKTKHPSILFHLSNWKSNHFLVHSIFENLINFVWLIIGYREQNYLVEQAVSISFYGIYFLTPKGGAMKVVT